MAGFVGEENAARGVDGHNGDRAALHQYLQLLFDFLAQGDLRFYFFEMLERCLAVADNFGYEETRSDKANRSHDQAGDGFIGGQFAEKFLENGTGQSD